MHTHTQARTRIHFRGSFCYSAFSLSISVFLSSSVYLWLCSGTHYLLERTDNAFGTVGPRSINPRATGQILP